MTAARAASQGARNSTGKRSTKQRLNIGDGIVGREAEM
jgi:hypothetical protein